MFTGIITDLGRVRDIRTDGDTRIEIGTGFDDASIADRRLDRLLGRLPDGDRQGAGLVRRPGLGRDAVAHHARRLATGHAGQSRARAEARRRARRASRLRPCRRRRPRALDDPGRSVAPLRLRGAAASRPLHRRERLGRRSTAFRSPSTRSTGARFGVNIIPHTLAVTTLGETGDGRSGEPGNRPVGAICCPSHRARVSVWTGRRSCRASRTSSKTPATGGCSSWSTTKTARTRAISSFRRRWRRRPRSTSWPSTAAA